MAPSNQTATLVCCHGMVSRHPHRGLEGDSSEVQHLQEAVIGHGAQQVNKRGLVDLVVVQQQLAQPWPSAGKGW